MVKYSRSSSSTMASSSIACLSSLLALLISTTIATSTTTTWLRQGQANNWPYKLTLTIKFDQHPEEISWKFENIFNGDSKRVLDGVAFGTYNEEMAGDEIEIPLDILTNEDYIDNELVDGQMREYKFIIYDRGGNGLCCNSGNGRYEIRGQGNKLLAQGFQYGAIDEHIITIDPRDFLNAATNVMAAPSPDTASNPTPSTATQMTSQTELISSTSSPDPTSSPTAVIDVNTWFCGESWDWVESNCDKALPCPGGDRIVCPDDQACFASTPCTLVPTSIPSTYPSAMPTETPTRRPTRAPWSESHFLEFINSGIDDSASGGGNTDGKVSAEVIDALEDSTNLQYHFFCGKSWADADQTCNTFCPTGDRRDCPDDMECFAHTKCDGRDTPPPVPSSPTNSSPTSTSSSSSTGNGPTNINGGGDEPVGQCEFCLTPEGEYLDLRVDRVIKQGGYEATCLEVNSIVRSSSNDSKLCTDSKSQLASKCCYDQCSLCDGDPSNIEWYATVQFQGVSTTCLGLDYMLRSEQISEGSDRCSELQNQYVNSCCTAAVPKNSCQLCMVDDKLYELDTTSCSAINDSLAANFEQDDQECNEGKQQYFGQCCDVSSVIVSQPYSGSMVPASSPSGQTLNNPTQPTSWGQAPSGNFTWIPSGGQVHFVSTGIIFGLSFIFFIFV